MKDSTGGDIPGTVLESAGKGDKPRPVNQDKYRENYDRIFRKGKKK